MNRTKGGGRGARSNIDYDVIIVGAGVGGLYSLYRLRNLGFSVRVIEAGSGVGGTWFWNKYPGCRCDVPSLQYSYSFSEELQQEWTWSELYATQPEILRYLNHVADRFQLRNDIQLDTTVTGATYDESECLWELITENGETLRASYCIMATGCLSVPRLSVLPQLEKFKGEVYYTAMWPEEGVDLSGKRVGVIGTSASGTQSIPHFAKQAEHLYVFQRTANFSVPSHNMPQDPNVTNEWKSRYRELREKQFDTFAAIIFDVNDKKAFEVDAVERLAEFERRWSVGGLNFLRSFTDVMTDAEANEAVCEFVREKIREIVKNPVVSEEMLPYGHAIGTRRICTDNGYYETFNRNNVTLVNLRKNPIEQVTESGIKTNREEIDLDVIVLATGFEPVVGALFKIDIKGRNGLLLRDKWQEGPVSYLGLATCGFPNLFTPTGPLSPSVLANLIPLNELHADWIANCLVHQLENHLIEIEATESAERAWTQLVQDIAKGMLVYNVAESSYLHKSPNGARTIMCYLGGFNEYRSLLDEVASHGYRGFELRGDERVAKQVAG